MASQGIALSKSKRQWQDVARELSAEHDPDKVGQLALELNAALLDELKTERVGFHRVMSVEE